MERSSEEISEIERHKYFLSEKRGYDVGWETAEQDWDQNFAEQWRRELRLHTWEDNEPECCESQSCEAEPATAEVACSTSDRVLHVDPPANPPTTPVGSLKRLFSRLLSKSTSS